MKQSIGMDLHNQLFCYEIRQFREKETCIK